jgi:hypothetical protein
MRERVVRKRESEAAADLIPEVRLQHHKMYNVAADLIPEVRLQHHEMYNVTT